MHKFRGSIISLTGAMLIAWSCAKQSAPIGGPKDEIPPEIVKSDPQNGSVNFTRKSFEVTFDEFITLDNIQQKLLVSPPMEKFPEVRIKGKGIVVNFDEELRDSTTYTFYFQDAIKDNNEGNALENFQYVFSTGPTLDSLSVTGTIYNALTLSPGEEMYVLLHNSDNDTVPGTTLPVYMTRANKQGRFRIDNLAGGTYSIYGLHDLNNNKLFDLEDEEFAFCDSTITLSPGNNYIPPMPDTLKSRADSAFYEKIPGKEYELFFFTAAGKKQYMTTSSRDEAYKLTFAFSLPVDSGRFSIRFPGFEETRFIIQPSVNCDTINIWLRDSILYGETVISALTTWPETDSTGLLTIKTDTIDLRYFAPVQPKGRKVKEEKPKLGYSTNLSRRTGLKPGEKAWIKFNTPVEDIDTSLIDFYIRRDTNLISLPVNIRPDSSIHNKFLIDISTDPDSSYVLSMAHGAFTDIYGHTTDSLGIKFKVATPDNFGIFTVNLSGFSGSLIIQLIRPDEKLVEQRKVTLPRDSKLRFENLDKGLYLLKAIFDLDGNGKWTSGDFITHAQPEPVLYYPQKIDIKVNWEIEEDWVIDRMNYKSDAVRASPSATRRRIP